MKDLTFTQLRTFARVARSGSFVRAADELDISQPAVSEQIRALEARLDCNLLLRRRGAPTTLTPKGQEALRRVEVILAATDSLFDLGRAAPDKVIVRIAVGPYLRDNYISPLIPRIHRELPQVEIEFRTMVLAAEAVRLFERGELDLALCSTSDDGIAPIKGSQIFELPLILVARPGTSARLAAGQASLPDFQYVFPIRRDMGGERWARDRLQGAGITPGVPPLFVELTREAARIVEDGQGIGCFMAHSVSEALDSGRLEVLDIALAPMRRIIACAPDVPEEARAVQRMLFEALSA